MSFYEKVRGQKFLSFSLVLFTLAIGVLIGTVIQTGAKAAKEQVVAADATPLTIPNPVQMQNEFSKIAKRLEPSVVNISTEYIPKKDTSAQAAPQQRQLRRRPRHRRMTIRVTTTACSSFSSASLADPVVVVTASSSVSRRMARARRLDPAWSSTRTATF